MAELLKLLRDAVGIRPLVPAVIILLAGLLFKSVREYPIRELLHDRWFLLTCLAAVSGAIAYEILSSGLAGRTYEGRLGVYVARLKGDPAGTLHLRLLEGLRANLELKAQDSPFRVEIRDLKQEIGTGEEADIETLAPRLNAAIVLWGTAIDEKSFYPRLWVRPGRSLKLATPLDVTNLSALADYSSTIWDRLAAVATLGAEQSEGPTELQGEVEKLRAELADIRGLIAAGSFPVSSAAVPRLGRIAAVLVGVADYDGQADLQGPANDLATLGKVLGQRGAVVSALLNKQVTKAAIERSIDDAAKSLTEAEPLIVYFSGHTGKDAEGKSSFYLPSLEPIPLAPLFRSVLAKHRASVFVVDGGFDVKEIPNAELPAGAVLSADPTGRGYATERAVDRTHMGSFTWAFVRAIQAAPQGIGAAIGDLFSETSAILRKASIEPQPSIVLGTSAPKI